MLLFVSTDAPLPTMTRWSRDLVFHLAGVLTATVGMTFWITGVSTGLSLAITYLASDVDVTGLTAEGDRVPVLRGGAWQI